MSFTPFIGTSGFSYKEWKGNFYPEKIAAKDMLAHYATQLASVEINNTFYRMPKKDVLESWAEQVPAGFRFVIKASRRITHMRRLKDTDEATGYLLDAVGALGDRLGAILFQLPPNFRLELDRLRDFLALLPEGTPAAFEFRHPDWFVDEVYSMLRERNCAFAYVDDDDSEKDVALVGTADWGYARLRRPGYSTEELTAIAQEMRKQEWKRAYVFFKHEDAGVGPALARQFCDILEGME